MLHQTMEPDMMSLLTLHTLAATRGDGLRPGLLTAIAQENLMSAAGRDGFHFTQALSALMASSAPSRSILACAAPAG